MTISACAKPCARSPFLTSILPAMLHGLPAGQRLGFVGVERCDAGVGRRAALDLAPDHAGHGGVGGKGRASGDLVGAVGANGALADPLVVGDDVHCAASRISVAVSRTARTILS